MTNETRRKVAQEIITRIALANTPGDGLAPIIELLEQIDSMRKALRGILQYGTRTVDEAENPSGVQIEDCYVQSLRLERAWRAAIEAAFPEKRKCPMCLGSGEPEQGVFKIGEPCPVCGTKKE